MPCRYSKSVIMLLVAVVALCQVPTAVSAKDWPQYRADAARSGYTSETLSTDLSLKWTYRPTHPPSPAWSGRDTRMPFDQAYHTVIASETVLFGSSSDCKVYALDPKTGAEKWSFFTDGPVRFAPAVWRDRAFIASDDGYLYCLRIRDGEQLWKLRGGIDEEMVLGNDRMISRRPTRGGPVIFNDTVYFGSGIWPSEKVHILAVEPITGKVIWENDSSGELVMEQPHGGMRSRSGVAAQGYFAADSSKLYVAPGRSVPAVFDRSNGELVYYRLEDFDHIGGADIVLGDEVFFNGNRIFNIKDGAQDEWHKPQATALTVSLPDGAVSWDEGHVTYYQWADKEIAVRDEKENPRDPKPDSNKVSDKTRSVKALRKEWSIPAMYGGSSLIMANNTIVSGGKTPDSQGISVVDMKSNKAMWFTTTGDPLGLAVADGRLYVSSDDGTISCHGAGGPGEIHVAEIQSERPPYDDISLYDSAVDEIIEKTGVTKGYCLDLGCGDGALAYALAQRTNLHIIAIDSDKAMVDQARKKLDSSGLYGVRVTVYHGDPTQTSYPDYFANLIVSGRSVTEGVDMSIKDEVLRIMRPCGGAACAGNPGSMKMATRGPLEGAGEWTHQYADAAGTMCSTDRIVRGPLEVLWFTDFGFDMPNRHGRGPAPLFKDGIMVVEGIHGLIGVDAYNGRKLWSYRLQNILAPYDQNHMTGANATNGTMCLDDESVFVKVEDKCLRIALETGKLIQEYQMPSGEEDKTGVWGYIACESGILYGSSANEDHVLVSVLSGFGKKNPRRTEDMTKLHSDSHKLFALDVKTGELKWSYKARETVTAVQRLKAIALMGRAWTEKTRNSIHHNAIAIGGGRVYLIDSPLMTDDLPPDKHKGIKKSLASSRLLCIDAATGEEIWSSDDDVYATTLALSKEHEVLLMGYQYSQRPFQLPSEKGGRITALRASDGERLWDVNDNYLSRPLINERTVYAQPHAYDLLTGKKDDDFILDGRGTGGCGNISGSKNLLLYRSGNLGYTDLSDNYSTETFGGVRPGCWINAIPAGGLVLMPDASDQCRCSYLIKTSIALKAYPTGTPISTSRPVIFPP
ncbi:PQQ-binding-like beta-propeller repeat protein [Candidatus Hydrogenedentota bacterium]